MPSSSTNPRYIAILAIASLTILVVGAMMRPEPEKAEPATMRTPSEIARLDRLTQRRSVEDYAEYFAYVASLVERTVLLLESTGHTGVIWDSGSVLTAAGRGPFPSRDRTALEEGELELTTELAGPHLPYVLLNTPVDVLPRERVPARFYSPGSWLVAVWRTPDGSMRYSEGHLLGRARRSCSGIDVTEVLTNFTPETLKPGSGLFDLDGNLVSVVLSCETETVAVDAEELAAVIGPDDSLETRLIQRYGMRVDAATDEELKYFGRDGGAIVREVWTDYGAHHGGVLPGDIVVSVDGQEIAELGELERLALPVSSELIDLIVWRNKRRRKLSLPARFSPITASSTHGFIGSRDGLPIVRTNLGSPAERAGALPGDRLIAVNQSEPQSFAEVDRVFSRAKGPVHLVFERHGRLWGAFTEQP